MGSITRKFVVRGATTLAVAGVLVAGGVATAMAADAPYGGTPSPTAVNSNLLTTYGVRAGSAGPDFLGISNTNVDLQNGTNAEGQSADVTDATTAQLVPLALWGGSVNENPNPYYTNLLYHGITGTESGQYEATTWMANPEDSAWGDSDGTAATRVSDGSTTIAGLEYSPDIIYGANKLVNWNLVSDGSNSETNMYNAVKDDSSYNPTFINNDSTNLWTQIYTMGQLAAGADKLTGSSSKTTRYNSSNATTSAINYEKAIRGQLLYVASQVDAGKIAKKTVAYLYAIDDEGTGYFFTPTADGLLTGDDNGKTSSSAKETADTNYAANNSTINMGYMATLPFVTNTFDSGNTYEGGIVMKVEDIYKANPTCQVMSDDTSALKDVDTIIYSSTKYTDGLGNGTSNGRNESGVNNAEVLNDTVVGNWATAHGYAGSQLIAGDDFGTSTQQQSDIVTAPTLYCQRNYTADKDTRAAWAFAQVFPELYGNNKNATYAYWVNKIYHVSESNVPTVVAYQTNQTASDVTYSSSVASTVESNAQAGYDWWTSTGKSSNTWKGYAYYTGSSRASYYNTDQSGSADANEAADTIGIFAPSSQWTASQSGGSTTPTASKKAQTIKLSKSKVKTKKGKTIKVKVKNAKGKIVAKVDKKAKKALKVKVKGKNITIKVSKKAKKGTYKVKVYAKAKGNYKKSATKTLKVIVK
ncbi:MAG: hypothetical protein LUD25_01855 [Coriobacteriaceae bacterium]|nr:hypothetical protein [Coriobacteriaceae bacterium]